MRNSLLLILFITLLLSPVLCFAQNTQNKRVDIIVKGNVKTKPEIIFRELEFSQGDSLCLSDLEKKIENSKYNLIRTQLFNFVDAQIVENENQFQVTFLFQERWYYWGYPILEHSERNLSSFIYYRDFSRINYGAAFDWYNFRGRDEVLKFKTRLGFKEHYSVSYHKPGFGKRRIDGLWVFTDFFRQKKTISSIENNLAVFSQNNQFYLKNLFDLGFEYSYRPKINFELNFGIKYFQYFYKYDFYQGTLYDCLEPKYVLPKLGLKYDSRNSIVYPTSGYLFNFRIASSLHLNQEFPLNISLNGSVQRSTPIGKSRFMMRNEIYAGMFISNNNKTVLFDELYDFYGKFVIRGYEYYYFPSNLLVGSKNTLSYKVFDLKFNVLQNVLPKEFSRFFSVVYLEAFTDFAYSQSQKYLYITDDNFNKQIVYSIGAGVSIETYYDRIIQFQIAYNSCFQKFGIFAEFKTPIYKTY